MKPRGQHASMLFDDPAMFQQAMLNDIAGARSYIFLEFYRIGDDSVGERFRDLLVRKCKEGVKVKLLLDSWGTSLPESFFEQFRQFGGEVRYFKKIKFFIDFFTKNHRRNHRKLLIIDDQICYIGSANLTAYSMKWRELMLRVEGPLAQVFRKTFNDSAKIYKKYIFNKFAYKRTIFYRGFEIVQDLPSIYRQQIKKRYEKLLQKARKSVYIETPYFLPGYKLRRYMMQAARRGVEVNVIIPLHSDVRSVDLLRSKYMGFYYNSKIRIRFYTPGNLHAKCVLVDDETFAIGSANFDYRSFRYQHEIMLFGKDREIVSLLKGHIEKTLTDCIDFDYEAWLRRPVLEKVFGWMLIPFRHLF
ncbi:phosphatidylserine/phosphatidylglycerophosphate/cardiolipin synthase [Lentimicrobium saccharophilum]|uniref:Phosphatidylserine/phosphatidylglycerophosphate/ cardiolipin synthase n=1 Tax=Lentimicrobium saccharophilum TaxID=1678841 RepID=A0A0S7C388_9BACT|nr:phosphatidylserine/phosphatidylglycerophosphate/cardiolipin synthase family protein [Lentimicrobium saccharophilum]GAP43512.1 phosphatidylserine/phosphatidylglycerophosphate/cardiolipin synthase [Lentimicrobium saccharophilum]